LNDLIALVMVTEYEEPVAQGSLGSPRTLHQARV
jgi:hypothetical protein